MKKLIGRTISPHVELGRGWRIEYQVGQCLFGALPKDRISIKRRGVSAGSAVLTSNIMEEILPCLHGTHSKVL